MLSSGAKAAKPSFVSYVSPEVRGGAGCRVPAAAGRAGRGLRGLRGVVGVLRGAVGSPWGWGGFFPQSPLLQSLLLVLWLEVCSLRVCCWCC